MLFIFLKCVMSLSLSSCNVFVRNWNVFDLKCGFVENNSNPDWGLEWKANQRKVVHTHCIQSSTTVRRWKIFWPTELLGKNRKTRDLLLISSVARQKIGTAWVTTVWQIGNGRNYQKKGKTNGICRNIGLKLLKVIPLNFHQKKLDMWKNAGKVFNVGLLM